MEGECMEREYLRLRASNLAKELRHRLDVEGYNKVERMTIIDWMAKILPELEEAS
jgi:hypothetical protein